MAEGTGESPERLADIILEASPPHVGHNIKASRRSARAGAGSAVPQFLSPGRHPSQRH